MQPLNSLCQAGPQCRWAHAFWRKHSVSPLVTAAPQHFGDAVVTTTQNKGKGGGWAVQGHEFPITRVHAKAESCLPASNRRSGATGWFMPRHRYLCSVRSIGFGAVSGHAASSLHVARGEVHCRCPDRWGGLLSGWHRRRGGWPHQRGAWPAGMSLLGAGTAGSRNDVTGAETCRQQISR